jgi:hypothetical protein
LPPGNPSLKVCYFGLRAGHPSARERQVPIVVDRSIIHLTPKSKPNYAYTVQPSHQTLNETESKGEEEGVNTITRETIESRGNFGSTSATAFPNYA